MVVVENTFLVFTKIFAQEQIVELFINQADYNKDDLYYIFTDKISELTGEEFSPHHEYSINYKKNYCIFDDFDIDYESGKKCIPNLKLF